MSAPPPYSKVAAARSHSAAGAAAGAAAGVASVSGFRREHMFRYGDRYLFGKRARIPLGIIFHSREDAESNEDDEPYQARVCATFTTDFMAGIEDLGSPVMPIGQSVVIATLRLRNTKTGEIFVEKNVKQCAGLGITYNDSFSIVVNIDSHRDLDNIGVEVDVCEMLLDIGRRQSQRRSDHAGMSHRPVIGNVMSLEVSLAR